MLALVHPMPLTRPDGLPEPPATAASFDDGRGGFSQARFYVEVDRWIATAVRRLELEREPSGR